MQDKPSENHGVVVEIMIAVYWFKRKNVGMRRSKTSSGKKKKKQRMKEAVLHLCGSAFHCQFISVSHQGAEHASAQHNI